MIPIPLTAPEAIPGHPGASRRISVGRLGAALVLLGLILTGVWWWWVSPASLLRTAGSNGRLLVEAADDEVIVVSAEGPGLADLDLPPGVEVVVQDESGRPVRTETEAGAGQSAPLPSYDVFGYEGRVVATFTAPAAGDYLVSVTPRAPEPDRFATVAPAGYGAGSNVAVGVFGGYVGLALVAGVPVVAGSVLMLVGMRRRGSATDEGPVADR